MAENMQVIAITHLPQIAARASQHLKVYKQIEDNEDRTVSRIRQLTPDERVNEVAVMLSSDPPTAAALQTARELMS
jgi:DNA repair protein RecN (Recombination protein N)